LLKAILIDDTISAERLMDLIHKHCKNTVEVIASEDSFATGFKAIELHCPDLVFMNIQLKDETCFDHLTKQKVINFQIIFMSHHEMFALQAVKFLTSGYLLKPLNKDELKKEVDKAIHKQNKAFTDEKIGSLLESAILLDDEKRMAVGTTEGYILIKISDIIYCLSHGHNTLVKLKNDSLISLRNLKEYDKLLCNLNFVRIHRSCIINLRRLDYYITKNGGAVVMSDKSVWEISKRRKSVFLSACEKMFL
jgi:two-component system LytT family response regulator